MIQTSTFDFDMKAFRFSICAALLGGLMLVSGAVFAQATGFAEATSALDAASAGVKTWFKPVTSLIWVIAAIVGVIGGFRIYNKWQNGDQGVQKAAVGWFGSVLFLLAIGAVVTTVFKIS